MTPIGSILRKSTREGKYNCVSFPTHERYQSNLANTNCNYWLLQGTPGVKGNGWIRSYAEMPSNHVLLKDAIVPAWVDLDVTFGQHRFGQAQTALQISAQLGVPSIILEHTTVTSDSLRKAAPQLKELRGNINVFISESSAQAWGWDLNDPSVRIVHHGVDANLFKPNPRIKKEPIVLSIVNDWVNRGPILGWDIFNRVIINNHIPFKILGDNPGISRPAQNTYELVQEYNKASIYYNTSIFSPIPSTLLEAMSVGLPVVSTDNFLISEIIENGVNGYKTNSESEQLAHIQRLLQDKDEREALGKAARQTIIDKFDLGTFVNNWNKIFDEVCN